MNDILEYTKHKEKLNNELETKKREAKKNIGKIKESNKAIQKINLTTKN